jgi:hypothetical protein
LCIPSGAIPEAEYLAGFPGTNFFSFSVDAEWCADMLDTRVEGTPTVSGSVVTPTFLRLFSGRAHRTPVRRHPSRANTSPRALRDVRNARLA